MTSAHASTAVLMPIRSFRGGKTRLSGVVGPERREALARQYAAAVRNSAGALPVVVMTDDPDVRAWASGTGADTIPDRGWDLNSSVTAAVDVLRDRGVERVVIAHADLPLADDLTWLAELDGIVIVPDRRADGTNVLSVPTTAGFRYSYGLASSHHHDGEALRLGLRSLVVRDPLLAWDVDVPEDLLLPTGTELAELREASMRVRRDTTQPTFHP